jgi:hypothetical protein
VSTRSLGSPVRGRGKDIGARGSALVRYRFYAQSAASFYRPRYDDILTIMSGDFRLGRIVDHTAGAELRWLVGHRGRASFSAIASYDVSYMRYTQIPAEVTAHMISVAARSAF